MHTCDVFSWGLSCAQIDYNCSFSELLALQKLKIRFYTEKEKW